MIDLIKLLRKDPWRTFLFIMIMALLGFNINGELASNSVLSKITDMNYKFNIVYNYNVNEMVRFVEKQYTKITEKPDDFYSTDLKYAIDEVWPYIPKDLKIPSLVAKFNYMKEKYHQSIDK